MYRFYVKTHKGRHDPQRKENMCVKTKSVVSETYFSTSIMLLSKALLNIFICETYSAPSRNLRVYIMDTTYAV